MYSILCKLLVSSILSIALIHSFECKPSHDIEDGCFLAETSKEIPQENSTAQATDDERASFSSRASLELSDEEENEVGDYDSAELKQHRTTHGPRLNSSGGQPDEIAIKEPRQPVVPLSDNTHYGPSCWPMAYGYSCRFARTCGQFRNNHMGPYIIGGQEANAMDWPSFAQIKVSYVDSSLGNCSGNLLTDWHVVTSGHCVRGVRDASDIRVYLGTAKAVARSRVDWRADPHLVIRRASKFCRHPQWANIVVLRLDRAVVFNEHVQPACWHSDHRDISSAKACYVVGSGATNYLGPEGKAKPMSSVFVKSLAVDLGNSLNYTNSLYLKFQYKPVTNPNSVAGGDSPCSGDTGGPIMCQTQDKAWVQFGVHSESQLGCKPINTGHRLDLTLAMLTSNKCSTDNQWRPKPNRTIDGQQILKCESFPGEKPICSAQRSCGTLSDTGIIKYFVQVINGKKKLPCYGALVGPSLVLTSHECTIKDAEPLDPSKISIKVGPFSSAGTLSDGSDRLIGVTRIERNRYYDRDPSSSKKQNMARLYLSESILGRPDLEPVCWPYADRDYHDFRSHCVVVGVVKGHRGDLIVEALVEAIPCKDPSAGTSCWQDPRPDNWKNKIYPLPETQAGNPVVCRGGDDKMIIVAVVSSTYQYTTGHSIIYATNIREHGKNVDKMEV